MAYSISPYLCTVFPEGTNDNGYFTFEWAGDLLIVLSLIIDDYFTLEDLTNIFVMISL